MGETSSADSSGDVIGVPEPWEGEGMEEDDEEGEDEFATSESEPDRKEEDEELAGDTVDFLNSGNWSDCGGLLLFLELDPDLGRSGALYARRFVDDTNCTGNEISFRLMVPAANFGWPSR